VYIYTVLCSEDLELWLLRSPICAVVLNLYWIMGDVTVVLTDIG
jgi:hypothetical protein